MAPSYDDDDDDDDEEEDGEEVDEDEEEDEEEEPVPVAKKKRTRGKKKKDPLKPKRNMSAYFLYSQAYRSQVKEDNPDATFSDIARILSAQYKALSEKERKKWEKEAVADKARYQEDMKSYVPPDDDDEDAPAGKKKKKKKDPNAPKRNMSAFFFFSNHIRPSIKKDNPDATFGEIAKIISSEYKALSDKERKKWELKAEEDKTRYQREMQRFKA